MYHLPVGWGVVAVALYLVHVAKSVIATTAPIIIKQQAIGRHATMNAALLALWEKGECGFLNALRCSGLLRPIQDS